MADLILPIPSAEVNVRDATLADIPFMDALQKLHRNQLGFMPATWFGTKIEKREVIVAVDAATSEPVGYCIGVDRYFRRDDVGIIYQMNVMPGKQRSFVGATLLRAMFDRSAYGCRLYCCWCAQDIEANRFWESMGFVPLAYRAGSEKKRRVHIFWQKRIREGDVSTPWWFPAKTENGAMSADRIVLPIPPGKHWSDDLPVLVPSACGAKAIADKSTTTSHGRVVGEKCAPLKPTVKRAKVQFGLPSAKPAPVVEENPAPEKSKPVKPKREKVKADPKLIAAARELRDRYLERVNENGGLLPSGKYDVSKTLSAVEGARALPLTPAPSLPAPLLPAA